MKHNIFKGIYFGRLEDRTNDEFILNLPKETQVKPSSFRWFCGMNDMQSTFICQAL